MDDGVYERIVMEQKDRLFGYSTMMLRDTAEAQDVAQEALVRLWQNRTRVEPEGAHLWLRRTAHTRACSRPPDPNTRTRMALRLPHEPGARRPGCARSSAGAGPGQPGDGAARRTATRGTRGPMPVRIS